MEEKDSLMMSFPSIPPNFISLQKLQQLRLQEKVDSKKKNEEDEDREKEQVQDKKNLAVTEIRKPTTSNGFYNQKKWHKGGREEVVSLKTVKPVDFEKSNNKDKEEEEIKTSNSFYKRKKWYNERRIKGGRARDEMASLKTLEQIDFEKLKKNKEKEENDDKEKGFKEKEEEKVLNGEITKPIFSNGFYRNRDEDEMGFDLKSQKEIDLKKFRKMRKNKKDEKKKFNLEKKLNNISIVADEKKKKMEEEKDESWRFIRNMTTSVVLSNPTTEIVQNFDIIRVVGDDQKGKNRRSTVGMNRGFGNGSKAKRRSGDNDEKNLIWVKKGESSA